MVRKFGAIFLNHCVRRQYKKWHFRRCCALQWFRISVNGRRSTERARPEVLLSLSMRCTAGCGLTDVLIEVTGTSAVRQAYSATWNVVVLAVAPASFVYLTNTWTRFPLPVRQTSRPTLNFRITVSKVSAACQMAMGPFGILYKVTVGWRWQTAVIISNSVPTYVVIDLSIYVCPQIFVAANGCSSRATRGISVAYGQSAGVVYVIYFPAHCAGATNLSPRDNLSPAVKIYRRHRHMRYSSAS